MVGVGRSFGLDRYYDADARACVSRMPLPNLSSQQRVEGNGHAGEPILVLIVAVLRSFTRVYTSADKMVGVSCLFSFLYFFSLFLLFFVLCFSLPFVSRLLFVLSAVSSRLTGWSFSLASFVFARVKVDRTNQSNQNGGSPFRDVGLPVSIMQCASEEEGGENGK